MHTRRFGAFLTGMWLAGIVLMWFATSQSLLNVERMFTEPPVQVKNELNNLGPDVARQLFRFQAMQFNRRMEEAWGILQLCLAGALLATSVLTPHRSRVVILCTLTMAILVAINAFRFTPMIAALSRSYDFLPPQANLKERELVAGYLVWQRTLNILKTFLALVLTARFMFDLYDFGKLVMPWRKPQQKRRRKKRRSGDSVIMGETAELPHTEEMSSHEEAEKD